jgi:thiol:disulfide interchange protein DsbC
MFRFQNRSVRRMARQGRPGWRQGRAVLVGAALAATLVGGSVAATGEERALLERLKKLYPASEFTAVSKTPLAGMFEVTMGPHVAYVGKDGRYFVFGRLVDLQSQGDAKDFRAAGSTDPAPRIDISELPLRDAIVQVHGSGARKLFVFMDPKCPGCDQLDANLSQLPDTTVYTFLAPALNPDSREAARKQWIVFMPERALETQVIDQNLQVAKRLGLTGMPTLIRGDGEVVSGAMPLPMLSAWLDAGTKVTQAALR